MAYGTLQLQLFTRTVENLGYGIGFNFYVNMRVIKHYVPLSRTAEFKIPQY